ncbi:MAG: GNAT family protein [Acidimicrobiales bacterium]|nr:GNAT family protein [Acidimicrobiales bacterium]
MRRAVATRPGSYLRKPAEQDGREFIDRVLASRNHLEPFVFAPDSVSAYRSWLARGRRGEVEQFLVCVRGADDIAGFVTLNNITGGALQSAAIGWAGFRPHLGAGHLTAGVSMVLELAFTQIRLHRVEANIQPQNTRSRVLATRTGFHLEGFSPRYLHIGGDWRDHERWAVLTENWRADPARRGGRP